MNKQKHIDPKELNPVRGLSCNREYKDETNLKSMSGWSSNGWKKSSNLKKKSTQIWKKCSDVKKKKKLRSWRVGGVAASSASSETIQVASLMVLGCNSGGWGCIARGGVWCHVNLGEVDCFTMTAAVEDGCGCMWRRCSKRCHGVVVVVRYIFFKI